MVSDKPPPPVKPSLQIDALLYGITVTGLILKVDAVLCETRRSGGGAMFIPGSIRTSTDEVPDQNNVIADWEYPEKRASRPSRRKGGAARTNRSKSFESASGLRLACNLQECLSHARLRH